MPARFRRFRDVSVIVGIALVLGGVVALNYFTRQRNLQERMVEWRKKIENNRESGGLELLDWSLLERTTGSLRRGPKFPERLHLLDGAHIDLVGFMVPIDAFRKMKQFLLLPMPLACYFCQAPPPRDILLCQMKEGYTAELYHEPILINGTIELQDKAGVKFFYIVKDVTFGPGKKDGKLTLKTMSEVHAGHYRAAWLAEEMAKEKKFEGRDLDFLKEDLEPMSDAARENLIAAELFFEENAKLEDVKELPHTGGVQYKVLEEGPPDAPVPDVHGRVKVHYRGTLLDGTQFDSSYDRDKPMEFDVNAVIPGWTDALTHMKEGDKWLVFVPPGRAYGEKGMGKTIPPNSALIFEIELLDVIGVDAPGEDAAPAAEPAAAPGGG